MSTRAAIHNHPSKHAAAADSKVELTWADVRCHKISQQTNLKNLSTLRYAQSAGLRTMPSAVSSASERVRGQQVFLKTVYYMNRPGPVVKNECSLVRSVFLSLKCITQGCGTHLSMEFNFFWDPPAGDRYPARTQVNVRPQMHSGANPAD